MWIKDQFKVLNATIENMRTRFQNELRCIQFDWDDGHQHESREQGDVVYDGWIVLDKIPVELGRFCARDNAALREFAEKILSMELAHCRYEPSHSVTNEGCVDYIKINVFDFEEQLEELRRIDKLLCRNLLPQGQ